MHTAEAKNNRSHCRGRESMNIYLHRILPPFLLSALTVMSAVAQADQAIAPAQGSDYAATVSELNGAGDPADAESRLTIDLMCGKTLNAPPGYIGSLQWYRKAADLGSAQAQYYLGGMYENGRRVPQDYGRAVQWYRQAANQGHAKAQVTLGFLYENGRGVPQDYTQAAAWYRKAADQGYAMAQFNMGTMYENGRGVPKDDALAALWYRKAADQGYAQALQRLADRGGADHAARSNNDETTGGPQETANRF